jgi:hypothetical protein
MFANSQIPEARTSPGVISEACRNDASAKSSHVGVITCAACGGRLHYQLLPPGRNGSGAIHARCERQGCIAIVG